MEMKGFEFVEVKRSDNHYRVFLKDSTFIGTYTEWEALLVAGAIERALAARNRKGDAQKTSHVTGLTGRASQH
jgi:hypothetical protein